MTGSDNPQTGNRQYPDMVSTVLPVGGYKTGMDNVRIGEKVRARRIELKLTQEQLASAAGTTQSTIERIESGEFKRMPSALPKVALRLGLSLSDLDPTLGDVAASGDVARGGAIIPDGILRGERDFPIHAAAEGGPGQIIVSSDPVDWMPRPAPLAAVKGAYGLYIVGDSMSPEFEPGDVALINPHLPPVGNSTVILYSERDGEARATIKRLRRASPETWYLTQWNPPEGQRRDFTLSRQEWRIAHRVIGKYSRS